MTSPTKPVSHIVIKSLFYGLVVSILFIVFYTMQVFFVAFVFSGLLALVLEPVVKFFEMRGFRRFPVVTWMFILASVAGILIIVLVIPKLISEGRNLADNLPVYKAMIKGVMEKLQVMLREKFPATPDLYPLIIGKSAQYIHFDPKIIMKYASNMIGIVTIIVTVPVILFFLLVDGHEIRKAMLEMVPNRYFELIVLLVHRIITALQLFIKGQVIDAASVGIMTGVGLSAIGIPYAIGIGCIAGLGNLIPYLGPIIGAMPALVVLLVTPGLFTVSKLLLVVAVFVVVQFIEGTFIYPIAVGKSVNLHPLIVILGVTVGGQVGGIIGMLIAVPLISVSKVTVEALYKYLRDYSIL